MQSLSPDYLARLRFDAQQLATLRALDEYRGKQQLFVVQSPQVLSDLRQVAVVESTGSSNRLQGVLVAAHRLTSLVLSNACHAATPVRAGSGGLSRCPRPDPRKRRADAVFGGHRPAAARHAVLCMHPFPDGNGRLARLLTVQLLYHFAFPVGRFISLERIFEESKENCYETLAASFWGLARGCAPIAPWLHCFRGALLRAGKEFAQRVRTMARGRGAKGDRVRPEILKRQRPCSIAAIDEACPGVSRDLVRVILRAMQAAGALPRQERDAARHGRKSRRRGKPDATTAHTASKPVHRLAADPRCGGRRCRVACRHPV